MIKKELGDKTREDLRKYFQDRDYMVIAVPQKQPARVYTLKASRTVSTAAKIHDLEGENLVEMARLIVGVLLLTSMIKHASSQKVLIKADGIIEGKTFIAEADGKGRVRGMIEHSSSDEPTLTVVRELGMGTPYTSIVPLAGGDISSSIHYYLKQSEQIPSSLSIDVSVSPEKSIVAGGFLIQSLGGISKEVLDLLDERSVTLEPPAGILAKGGRPEDIAVKILRGMEPSLIGLKEVEYYCPCSEEVARASLLMLSEEEIKEITREGPAEVVCKFCKKVYRFSGEDIINMKTG